ncbi:unnamed protein product [Victoria cruziana]
MVVVKMSSCAGHVGGRRRSCSLIIFLSLTSFFRFHLTSFFRFHFCSAQTPERTLHPDDEIALKEIGSVLGNNNWDFNVDPCTGASGWADQKPREGLENDVQCACTENGASCYISSILLKGQGLAGTLPKQLTELQQLGQFDVSRNYLNGTIPKEWAALRIVNMSLDANRLTGSIPKELGRIITLKNISVEGNQLSGEIPPEIGDLIYLERLILSSNNFTGELPQTLERLTNMMDFRISDNAFSGKIPEFIGKWTNLNIIEIQGTNLAGPIPSGISNLKRLSKLIISGIKGTSSNFPDVRKMTALRTLVLRDCMLSGQIPEHIGQLKSLKLLDLSFNKLTGEVPKCLREVTKLTYLFLTNNSLTGPLEYAQLASKRALQEDLSYNNFTNLSADAPTSCSEQSFNLVKGVKAWEKDNVIHYCLRGSCNGRKPKYLSFHINCGSQRPVTIGRTTYEADNAPEGAAVFFIKDNKWALSNTGTFLGDDDDDNDKYTVSGEPPFVPEAERELYSTARVSPISLKYFGLCLYNGPYTVKLHFAEIVITDDKNFSSLGTRTFDVYIQGKLEKKNFDIRKAAGMSGKAFVLNFTSVNVENNTLEIHFFWDGKGTTEIPERGVYGPLVSAISVEAGLFSLFLLTFFIGGTLWKVGYLSSRPEDPELGKLDPRTGSFTLRQIKAATKNFDAANKIGEGGFGSVYKGHLSDGTIVAVKQLSSKSRQGSREFITEIGLISGLQHPNLVKLYGCCTEGRELLLVYEYMENNSLAHLLFGQKENKLKLDWPTRRKICIGIARGLAYLHEESTLKIVHRDIKCTNILLDKDLNAKISDFGLAKLDDEDNTHISTRIAGTFGYMAPEYAMRGRLSYKTDVYGFGVVTLEIVSGKTNVGDKLSEEGSYLPDRAFLLQNRGNLLELVDPELGTNYSKEEALVMLNVALLCTNWSPSLRPTMSTALNMLEGRMAVEPLSPALASSSSGYLSNRVLTELSQNSRKPSRSQSWSYSRSTEMQSTATSLSGPETNDGSEHRLAESSQETHPSS